MVIKHYLINLIILGVVVFLLGIEQGQVERAQIKIRELEKHLIAYEHKVDDLSVAFINHHGDYPRRIYNVTEER